MRQIRPSGCMTKQGSAAGSVKFPHGGKVKAVNADFVSKLEYPKVVTVRLRIITTRKLPRLSLAALALGLNGGFGKSLVKHRMVEGSLRQGFPVGAINNRNGFSYEIQLLGPKSEEDSPAIYGTRYGIVWHVACADYN